MCDTNIEKVDLCDELKKSYIDYAMSVITSRAIPNVLDGLKPVQRRILYDMDCLSVDYNKPTKKSARIVGDTMGKYHPHGDSSIYESLVVMSQPFKRNIPLVDGQGNMGSIEGDGAAAQRYTEARLQKFSQEVLLSDLDSTVDFVPNYDANEKEPVVLPARLPMLLLNGSEGIAVGMNTSTPQHNLNEVCDLCTAYISDPEMSLSDMLKIMPGPDFPTGGIIANKCDISSIYETGTGKIRIRGKIELEKGKTKREHDKLIVSEIPYTMIGMGIGKFIQDVIDLIENKTLPEVTDISNQSSKDGFRIVLDLKPGYDFDRIINILYKKTKLEDTFGVNMLAIHNGRPYLFTLPMILKTWYEYQKELITRKYSALLIKLNEKQELEEGLIKACDCIDLIIEVIRGAKTVIDAKDCFVNGNTEHITFKKQNTKSQLSKLRFTEAQADAILKMQLQKLIGLELEALRKEHDETIENIEECEAILKSDSKKNMIIKKSLASYKKSYCFNRKTEICDAKEAVYVEKKVTIPGYFLIDRFGYCKFIDDVTYERNQETIPDQYKYCIKTSNESRIILFTSDGKAYQVKCSDVPLSKYKDKGIPVENISSYTEQQDILFITDVENMTTPLLFITKNGFIKSVDASEFVTAKKEISSTKLSESDELIKVAPLEKKFVVLVTTDHYMLKLNSDYLPKFKKNTIGARGIKLKSGVVSVCEQFDDCIEINGCKVDADTAAGKFGSTGKIFKN